MHLVATSQAPSSTAYLAATQPARCSAQPPRQLRADRETFRWAGVETNWLLQQLQRCRSCKCTRAGCNKHLSGSSTSLSGSRLRYRPAAALKHASLAGAAHAAAHMPPRSAVCMAWCCRMDTALMLTRTSLQVRWGVCTPRRMQCRSWQHGGGRTIHSSQAAAATVDHCMHNGFLTPVFRVCGHSAVPMCLLCCV